eukprot:10975071-Alexandrium_andersonii.AAC.1
MPPVYLATTGASKAPVAPSRPNGVMQPKAAPSCRMKLSATLGSFVQPCAPVGALSRWLRALKQKR